VVVMALVLSLMMPLAAPLVPQGTRVQPLLLEMAAQDPDQTVSVIVQKTVKDDRVEQAVGALGGKVTKDLHIINAFAAVMTAQDVAQLAKIDGVKWVSLDGHVTSAGQINHTVRDEFISVSYSNNNGTQSWAGNWIETGEEGSASSGSMKITSAQLQLANKTRTLYRAANLTGTVSATLSFQYKRSGLDDANDYVALQISANGGTTWTELARFAGKGTDSALQTASYDITGYRAANTTIRFATSGSLGSSDMVYVDNVQIAYTVDDGTPTGPNARDEFTTNTYAGNNGTLAWKSNWVEDDPGFPGQNPADGFVQVTGGKLRLGNNNTNDTHPSAARSVDIHWATSATLSFDFSTSSGVNLGDQVAVEVSPDGGSTYYVVGLIRDIVGATTGHQNIDITRYATSQTTIRFRIGWFYFSPNSVYIDNVQVTYTPGTGQPVATNTQTVADDFEHFPYVYDNDAGTRDWLMPWQEINEADGPGAGAIYQSYYEGNTRLVLWTDKLNNQPWQPVRGVWRSANLSGATTATLSLIYKRVTMEATDYVAVEASNNGGATWTEVGRIAASGNANNGGSDPGWLVGTYNLSPFISANTAIRLISNFGNHDYYDTFYVDEIEITFTLPNGPTPPNTYLSSLNVQPAWNAGLDGRGVTVAVIDSGIALNHDFSLIPGDPLADRIVQRAVFNQGAYTKNDAYGHGTHVAGIIAGNGSQSGSVYKGIAPGANLISLRVSDNQGMSTESDVVSALQWVLDNKTAYNIRVVNLSLNAAIEQSYHTSPLCAAVEILWFNQIVVVASAGNTGEGGGTNAAKAAPANDPFIITVGATDERGTASLADDVIAPFSSNATTLDGHFKPDIVAPGKNIIGALSASSWWRTDYADRVVNGNYFRISGTSTAAPMVAGAVALLLQDEPNLTPDQVKYRLTATANKTWPGYNATTAGAGYLDVSAAVNGTTTQSANTGTTASQLLWTGSTPVNWGSVQWGSVQWGSVQWGSVQWGSVQWGSVQWGSDYWGP
jgi:serine protease AprX